MSLDRFDEIRHQSSDIEVGIGASSLDIDQAQFALGVTFSASYVQFLKFYGWAKLKYDYVYGLGEGIPDYLNVVKTTILEREAAEPALPRFLVPIMNDGSGNHYCLDSRQSNNGEMTVVFWDHESPDGKSQVPEIVSPSFDGWLVERTKLALG